ncbi:2-dehydropantoate 2-reductase [Cupriavidus sp. CuC1]|uniref:2-dehydropantoate 2-reductase n=1 Tax=Cupriavidus sp. CuC1 TaxID=3373131 RepID=UPI0037D12C78
MNICIYGLGAVGGLMAAKLALAKIPNAKVNAVVRGDTLEAVRQHGLTLIDTYEGGERSRRASLDALGRPEQLGPQDVVILAVKATAMPAVARDIAPLLGPDTAVVSAMNGISWWFFHGLAPELALQHIRAADPDGATAAAIPAERVVGCVTHLSATSPAPGTVRHIAGNRLILGEPDPHRQGSRAGRIAGLLREAGFEVEESERIQQEIWFKLWGNMTVNPISAITGATGDRILDDELVRQFMSRCMLEAAAVGESIGLQVGADPESRHAVTRRLGAFRTSMLQDVEACKPVELDALVGTVLEIATHAGAPAPNLEALYGLARLHARVRGLY